MPSRHTQHASPRATARPRESTQVQSVERAAALLRAVATASGPSATATALAQTVGLNRTTTWRILATLEQQRLVSLDRETGCYSLGFGLIDLAGQAGDTSLARTAHAVLQRLAAQTGETAALAVMRDGALTYVAEAVGGAIVSVTWQGRPVSMHATSTGKVLLAFSEPDEVPKLLNLPRGGRLTRFTSTTITSRAALTDELVQHPRAWVLRVPGRVRRVGLGRVRTGPRRRRPPRRDPQHLGTPRADHRQAVRPPR